MKILFLHGWHSVVGGLKPTYLKKAGHEVINPKLDDEDFDVAIRTAQSEFDQHQPDVIVGSSRGGAVAMNIESGDTPLVLLCPAWKKWGTAKRLKPNAVILHSRNHDVIPFEDSEDLVLKPRFYAGRLIEVGNDHRLAEPEPLLAMLDALFDLTWLGRIKSRRFLEAIGAGFATPLQYGGQRTRRRKIGSSSMARCSVEPWKSVSNTLGVNVVVWWLI
ncbi:alpha/beta hydrolase [Rosistilla oblonga]|uniref:alpha/beta hydrolase n=1 Tax=Rosistilla oblonga TaxID=2527990 RepID=UPI003A979351